MSHYDRKWNAPLKNHLRHCTYKDDRCRNKKMTGLRIVCCARSSLTGVGQREERHRLGQVVFDRAELRHPSCATLGTGIIRFADFLIAQPFG
jgi:hypothetical protein